MHLTWPGFSQWSRSTARRPRSHRGCRRGARQATPSRRRDVAERSPVPPGRPVDPPGRRSARAWTAVTTCIQSSRSASVIVPGSSTGWGTLPAACRSSSRRRARHAVAEAAVDDRRLRRAASEHVTPLPRFAQWRPIIAVSTPRRRGSAAPDPGYTCRGRPRAPPGTACRTAARRRVPTIRSPVEGAERAAREEGSPAVLLECVSRGGRGCRARSGNGVSGRRLPSCRRVVPGSSWRADSGKLPPPASGTTFARSVGSADGRGVVISRHAVARPPN